MSFFGRGKLLKEKDEPVSTEPVLLTLIDNRVSSEIFQDILKSNGIPFICRQRGAGAFFKVVSGGYVDPFSPDYIYVNPKDVQTAQELYDGFINSKEYENIE